MPTVNVASIDQLPIGTMLAITNGGTAYLVVPDGMSPLVWMIACHFAGPKQQPTTKQLEDAKRSANVIAFLGV